MQALARAADHGAKVRIYLDAPRWATFAPGPKAALIRWKNAERGLPINAHGWALPKPGGAAGQCHSN